MSDIRTTYMGIPMSNPIVVGACSLSKRVDMIKQLEEAGAGALVIKSLFEEQVQLESGAFEDRLAEYDNIFAEALTMFPKQEHGGARSHLYWTAETRRAVKMPLIASLNAVNYGTWIEYARQLESTGVDGLELNFYSPPLDPSVTAGDIEKRELEVLAGVVDAVKIPVSVKLHPFYTSLPHYAEQLASAGARALVLFNRLFEPDIDVTKEAKEAKLELSSPELNRSALRWTALLSEHIKLDIVSSTGIMSGGDIAKMILAGAQAVQVVSAIYAHGALHLGRMQRDLQAWMCEHGYKNLAEFRGKLARPQPEDRWHFERGQYIKAVLGFD